MGNSLTEVPLLILNPGETVLGTSAEKKKAELLPLRNARADQPLTSSPDCACLPVPAQMRDGRIESGERNVLGWLTST